MFVLCKVYTAERIYVYTNFLQKCVNSISAGYQMQIYISSKLWKQPLSHLET